MLCCNTSTLLLSQPIATVCNNIHIIPHDCAAEPFWVAILSWLYVIHCHIHLSITTGHVVCKMQRVGERMGKNGREEWGVRTVGNNGHLAILPDTSHYVKSWEEGRRSRLNAVLIQHILQATVPTFSTCQYFWIFQRLVQNLYKTETIRYTVFLAPFLMTSLGYILHTTTKWTSTQPQQSNKHLLPNQLLPQELSGLKHVRNVIERSHSLPWSLGGLGHLPTFSTLPLSTPEMKTHSDLFWTFTSSRNIGTQKYLQACTMEWEGERESCVAKWE